MKTDTNNTIKKPGCPMCRKLNDGICANYCQLSKDQRKKLINRLNIVVGKQI